VSRALPLALVGLTACARTAPPPSLPPAVGPRHVQIVHAATTGARAALFERFRARNGLGWTLEPPGDVTRGVDGIRGFVRRAHRRDPEGEPVPLDVTAAEARAFEFVAKNVDLLGLTSSHVHALEIRGEPLAGGGAGVLVSGRIPMKGYESFDAVASIVEVALAVGRDGEVRALVNASRIHPRLSIDTRPRLGPEDPRVVASVVGRRVFSVVRARGGEAVPVEELRRIQHGVVEPSEIAPPRLTIHVSPGPASAWVTYRLAYEVRASKSPLVVFGWVVDADTGEVLEDARPPIVTMPWSP
jgi:hypothetical protein